MNLYSVYFCSTSQTKAAHSLDHQQLTYELYISGPGQLLIPNMGPLLMQVYKENYYKSAFSISEHVSDFRSLLMRPCLPTRKRLAKIKNSTLVVMPCVRSNINKLRESYIREKKKKKAVAFFSFFFPPFFVCLFVYQ